MKRIHPDNHFKCARALACSLILLALAWTGLAGRAAEPPVIPVGLDAYRMWERWPIQRIGARAYMRSTYDRTGGNRTADASHFLHQLADDYSVTLDVEGAGVLYFARYNHWHGSPWHYVVDGRDHLIRETATADPGNALRNLTTTTFLPAHLFPPPLVWTWSTTKGADLMWVPIPFEKSIQMAYSRTRYGTGYYIYHQYVPGARLSQPLRAWNGATAPDPAVLELISRAGTDLAPQPGTPEGERAQVRQRTGSVTLPVQGAVMVDEVTQAPATMRALEFIVPRDRAIEFGRARLRITWDGRAEPSVDAPLALFFGTGTLYNRDAKEYLVKAFPVFVRFQEQHAHLACFFPMPFFRSARIELVGNGASAIPDIQWRLRTTPLADPPNHVGYFHATFRDHPQPVRGQDLVLLDTQALEGSREWSGSFIGSSFIFSDRAVLTTLEGDPRFFFDDSETPQAYGTGTEEWGGGGDYWGGRTMTLPFAGHPVGARNAAEAKNEEDKIESAYRFLLADLMPFGRRAVIRLEHGGVNESEEHYQTVAYWYGRPGASLVKTDILKIGDAASERAHDYRSPQASEPYEITSRYEWGPDTLPGAAAVAVADAGPLAAPKDYADFEFEAPGDVPFTIWVRGRNLDGSNQSDAFWLQFDEDIGTARLGAGHNHAKGFGNWLDRFPANTWAWSSALPQDPPQTVVFTRTGKHRLRVQPRHPKHEVEAIWLSASQKKLPEAGFQPPASQANEIVLLGSQAIRLGGKVSLRNEVGAKAGKILVVDVQAAATGASPAEIYATHTDYARKTTGASEFTLKTTPDNFGVMLRRKLDYAFPNQRALVYVADASKPEAPQAADWKPAGAWYLAGANTCVFSNPKEELGATVHTVITSNRRFRDDEFLIPLSLTQGRTALRIRVEFTPVRTPLFPGHPLPELAWTELRYDAFCFVLPPTLERGTPVPLR